MQRYKLNAISGEFDLVDTQNIEEVLAVPTSKPNGIYAISITGGVASLAPATGQAVGSIQQYASITGIPTNELILTGTPTVPQEVSRTTYATLYAVIGDVFGVSIVPTNFILPPIVGLSPKGGTVLNYIDNGGSDTLNQNQLPVVNASGNIQVSTNDGDILATNGAYFANGVEVVGGTTVNGFVVNGNQGTTVSIDGVNVNFGSGQPHEHPYQNFIYTICFESVAYGAVSPTPNLQQVTDVANTTTNSIIMNDTIGGSIDFKIIDLVNNKRIILEAGLLLIEDTNTGNKTIIGDTGFQFTRNNINSISLDVNALTDNRNQNYQDKNGTIALLSDITSATTLQAVTNNENSTTNEIVILNGLSQAVARLRNNSNNGEIAVNNAANTKIGTLTSSELGFYDTVANIQVKPPVLTAARIQTLQDADGVIALTSDVTAGDNLRLEKSLNLSDVAIPNTALNNILPLQTGNTNKVLATNGTDTLWVEPADNVISEYGIVNITGQVFSTDAFVDSLNGVFNLPSAGTWKLRYDISTDGNGVTIDNSMVCITDSSNVIITGSEKSRGGASTTAETLTAEVIVITTGASIYKLRGRNGATGAGSMSILNTANYDSTLSWQKISGFIGVTGLVVTGATQTNNGISGLVPAPVATEQFKVLKGNGLWSVNADAGVNFLNRIAVIGATSLFVVPSAGLYQIQIIGSVVSPIGNRNVTAQVIAHTEAGVVRTKSVGAGVNTNNLNNFSTVTQVFQCDAGTTINYSNTMGGTTGSYNVRILITKQN